jgi:hypothetical protein
MHEIQSVGLPPERHADHVVAAMMRQLAEARKTLWETVAEAIVDSSDGSPKAQRKMEQRIRRAGAVQTEPGERELSVAAGTVHHASRDVARGAARRHTHAGRSDLRRQNHLARGLQAACGERRHREMACGTAARLACANGRRE